MMRVRILVCHGDTAWSKPHSWATSRTQQLRASCLFSLKPPNHRTRAVDQQGAADTDHVFADPQQAHLPANPLLARH